MNANSKSTCKRASIGSGVLLLGTLIFGYQPYCRAESSGSPFLAIKAAATAGDASAQDRLAGEFMRHEHFVQAEFWYRQAAKQGCVDAQAMLGEMLLTHAGLIFGLKPNVIANFRLEGMKWLTLAAQGGSTLAQAELAGAYFSGYLIKADLLEAYKWGDIAAKAPPSVPGSKAGRSVRDAAISKMSFDQIAKAKQQVVTFYTHASFTPHQPDPTWLSQIKLTGVSGPVGARLAIINNQTFGVGETSILKVAGKAVQVNCVEIRDKSAVVRITGVERPRLLILTDE